MKFLINENWLKCIRNRDATFLLSLKHKHTNVQSNQGTTTSIGTHKNVAVVYSWLLFRGYFCNTSSKLDHKIAVVVDRLSLFGRWSLAQVWLYSTKKIKLVYITSCPARNFVLKISCWKEFGLLLRIMKYYHTMTCRVWHTVMSL